MLMYLLTHVRADECYCSSTRAYKTFIISNPGTPNTKFVSKFYRNSNNPTQTERLVSMTAKREDKKGYMATLPH